MAKQQQGSMVGSRMSFCHGDLMQKIVFAGVLVCASWCCLSGKHRIHGDGLEYILQTQAIALHGRLSINSEAMREYWNATNPYGIVLTATRHPEARLSEHAQAGGGWGGLYPDRFGVYRYYHFWVYSLAVAPLYLLLHQVTGPPFEYHAFKIANWLLLLMPFVAAWLRKRSWTLTAVIALCLVSPLIPYTDWQHPELFCFALIFFSFLLISSPRGFWWAPLPLGLAAAQNIPIVLLFPLHFAWFLSHHRKDIRASRLLAMAAYGAALLLTAGSLFYWHHYFRHLNVIAAVGVADLQFASLRRVTDLFLSPAVGAIWLYPTLFLFLPAVIRKRDLPWVALALVTTVSMAYLASATRNFNAGQVGSLRYALWILAPFWYLLVSRVTPEGKRDTGHRIALLAGLMLINLAIIAGGKYDRLARKDTRRFEGGQRGVRETAALYALLHYNDDTEILVETIRGGELRHPSQFRGVYLWTLDHRTTLCVLARPKSPGSTLAEWTTPLPFTYQTDPKGSEVIQFTNGLARLVIPANATYRKHPYLGDAITVWMNTAVNDVHGFVETCTRDSR